MLAEEHRDQNEHIILCFCLGALKTLYVNEEHAQHFQVTQEEGDLPKLTEKLRLGFIFNGSYGFNQDQSGNQQDNCLVSETEELPGLRDPKYMSLRSPLSLKEYLERNKNEFQTDVLFLNSRSYEKKLKKRKAQILNDQKDNMCIRQGCKWFTFPLNGKDMFGKFKNGDYSKLWLSISEVPNCDTYNLETQIRAPLNDGSRVFKFLVFGKPGVGKSTFLDCFFDNNSPDSISKSTKKIISQTGTFQGYHVKVYDTPGFGDLAVNVNNWILQFLWSRVLWEKLDKLFFVLRADYPLDQYEILMLRLIAEFVHSSTRNPSSNIVLIFTHYDKLDKEEQENFTKQIEEKLAVINFCLNKSWKICHYYSFSKYDYQTTITKIFSDCDPVQKDERLFLKTPNISTLKSLVKEVLGIDLEKNSTSIKLKPRQNDVNNNNDCAC